MEKGVRIFRKVLKRVLLGILLLAALGFALVFGYLQRSKPTLSGETRLEGLGADAEVHFDAYGVPHIYAANEEDAYQVFGYLHAQDRLFQMEMLRRAAGGRLAEVLGPELLDVDKLFRTLGFNQFARAHSQRYLSGDTAAYQRAVHAYLRGVNQYVAHGKTPLEFSIIGIPKTEFTPDDIYLVIGFMALGFAEGFEVDPVLQMIVQEYGPAYLDDLSIETPADAEIIPVHPGPTSQNRALISKLHETFARLPLPLLQGSNGWVISGARSSSGFPILANDTHIGFSQPAVWYEAHIEYPGFSFYGHHLAGLPFGILGNNRFCGWGLTMFENDDVDFFIEELNPANPDQVRFRDGWEDLAIRREIIHVKDEEDVELVVRESRHGPLVNGIVDNVDATMPVAVSWLLLKQDNLALQAAYQLGRASTFAEAGEAIAMFTAPGLNFMYGDTAGNIAWWARGLLPVRPPHVQSKLFLDGAGGNDEYLGFYGSDHTPRSINPPWGFVYSANNQPDTIAGVLHPGYYFPKSRAGRIAGLLSKAETLSVDDVKSMMLDNVSLMHPELAQTLAGLVPPALLQNNTIASMRDVLREWNGEHTADAAGPVVYYNVLGQVLRHMLSDELGDEAFGALLKTALLKNSLNPLLNNEASPWWDDVSSKESIESREDIIGKAFTEAAKVIRETCGVAPADWKWDRVHTLTHAHPLGSVKPLDKFFNVGPFPVSGGSEVINNLDFPYLNTGHFAATSGPALRKITDFGSIDDAVTVSPTGQSGNVMSPHYDDQADLFVKGDFRPMLMNRKAITTTSSSRIVFHP